MRVLEVCKERKRRCCRNVGIAPVKGAINRYLTEFVEVKTLGTLEEQDLTSSVSSAALLNLALRNTALVNRV